MKNDVRDLHLVLDARVKLIVLESWDELRVLQTLTQLAIQRATPFFVWSITKGLHGLNFADGADEETSEPVEAVKKILRAQAAGLYVFCDLHPFLEDNPLLVRLLKEIAMQTDINRPSLILVSHQLNLPVELQRMHH